MKLIDLFSRMVTNKELPEKIKFKNKIWTLDYPCFTYRDGNDECIEKRFILENLTEEVEIIEEPQEHKIPEKINWKEKESMAGYLTKDKQIEVIAKRTEHLKKSINEILDYLEVNND